MYVVVAGCGRVGARLAEFLSSERHDVVVIDRDRSSFRRLGGTFNGVTLEGVAFDEGILLEAGIEQADAFAAVTNLDNTNLMAAEVASRMFDVPLVVSRLYDPEKELTYFKLGVDYISGTTLLTDRIRERLFQSEDTIVLQDRFEAGVQLVEFSVGPEAEGKSAGDLSYGISSKLLVVLRGRERLDISKDTPLKAGDRVVITLRKEGWKTVSECLGSSVDMNACPDSALMAYKTAVDDAISPDGAKVIIGGCSQVGAHLAHMLSMEGNDVVIIDEEPPRFKRLPPSYDGRFLEGVVYDEETLLAAGIEEADAFVSVTKQDNKNLMAAEVARHVFGVPHVIARLFNPDKEPTYQALGMPFVCGTTLLTQVFMERLLDPLVRSKSACLFNKYNVVEFECPRAWDSKPVRHVVDNTGVILAYVLRRGTGFMPEENFVLREGDSVTALITIERLQRLERNLEKIAKG